MGWSRLLFRRWDVRVSILFVVASAISIIWMLSNDCDTTARDIVIGIWVIWTVAPPLYFLMEWTAFTGSVNGLEFQTMKYSHELASKFWIGGIGVVSAALIASYGGADKIFSETATCENGAKQLPAAVNKPNHR